MWMPVSNLPWIDFGMMAPEQLLLKLNRKMDLALFQYGVEGNFMFFSQEENEV